MHISRSSRVTALILVFIIGFLSCIISIFGAGYLAASKLSIEVLENLGIIQINDEDYISPDAEVSLKAMTLLGLINEFDAISKIEQELTLEKLFSRYGMILTDEALAAMPDGLLTVDIRDVFAPEGVDHILTNTNMDYILKFIPEDAISAPAREVLSGKTLKTVVTLDLTHLLADIHIGYFTGVNYALTEDGEYKVVFNDPDAPTLLELVAPLDLGSLLDAFTSNGDFLAVVARDLGDVMLESLMSSLIDIDSLGVPGLFEGTLLEDVLKIDEETGKYVFDIAKSFEGKLFGDILGYEPVYLAPIDPDAPAVLIGWIDGKGESVTGIMRGVACASLDSFAKGEGFDIEEMLSAAYFGDVLGYVPMFDAKTGEINAWRTVDGEAPDSLLDVAINKPLEELMSGNFEISSLFEGKFVGDAMSFIPVYEKDENGDFILDENGNKIVIEWMKENGEPVTGMDSIVANIDIGKMMGDSDYEISSVFEGKFGGDMLGYTPVYELDEFGNPLLDENGQKIIEFWKDGDKELTGADKGVANLDLGKLLDEDEDYDISDAFDGVYFGEFMGYERGDAISVDPDTGAIEYEWYDENGELIGELDARMANYVVGDVMSGDKVIDSDELTDGLTLADIMEYTKKTVYPVPGDPAFSVDLWYDGDTRLDGTMSALADAYINDISNSVDNLQVGDVLGFVQYAGVWYSVEERYNDDFYLAEAEGLILHMADLKLSELDDNDIVDKKIQGIEVGEVMGFTKNEDGVWCDENGPVTGIMKVISTKKVNELDNSLVDDMTIADVMEYEKATEADPEKDIEIGDWLTKDGEKVDGIMGLIAGDPVGDIESRTSSLMLGEIMGYDPVYDVDGETILYWKDGNTEATGVMVAFASLTINDMSDDQKVTAAVNTIIIGDALGYRELEDGTWVDDQNMPVTGVMASIVGCRVDEIDAKVEDLTVAEVLGYYQDESGQWWEKDAHGNSVKLDGIMSKLADAKLNELNSEVHSLYFGDIVGYTPIYDEDNNIDGWVDDNQQPAKGVTAAFADLKIDDMSDTKKVEGVIQGITIADAMGYEYDDENDVWRDGEGEVVTGVLSAIADSKVSDLDSAIDSITIADMFDESERSSGFLNLLPEDTTLSELSGNGENSLTSVFKNKCMQDFIDAGLVSLDDETVYLLNNIDILKANIDIVLNNGVHYIDIDGDGIWDSENETEMFGWRTQTIDMFIPYIVTPAN